VSFFSSLFAMTQVTEEELQQQLSNQYIDSIWENYQKDYVNTPAPMNTPETSESYEVSDDEEGTHSYICPHQILQLMDELDQNDTQPEIVELKTADQVFQFMRDDVNK
jgi:hypothetical protein